MEVKSLVNQTKIGAEGGGSLGDLLSVSRPQRLLLLLRSGAMDGMIVDGNGDL